MSSPSTAPADRILDAAEQLFVEHGFAATSMRMITGAAEVNIAAVNYYFNSKDGLVLAVFERRAEPFAVLLSRQLDETSARPADVATMAKVLIGAALALAEAPEHGGLIFLRLMSRTFVETPPELKNRMMLRFGPIIERYQDAMASALHPLSRVQAQWRFQFAMTTIFNAFAGNNVLRLFSDQSVVNARDPRRVAAMLLPFIEAGLAAPAAEGV
ncbi:TetR/AcrR family transcriptional regulator [Chitinibacteraceae bacterium HSL-7]